MATMAFIRYIFAMTVCLTVKSLLAGKQPSPPKTPGAKRPKYTLQEAVLILKSMSPLWRAVMRDDRWDDVMSSVMGHLRLDNDDIPVFEVPHVHTLFDNTFLQLIPFRPAYYMVYDSLSQDPRCKSIVHDMRSCFEDISNTVLEHVINVNKLRHGCSNKTLDLHDHTVKTALLALDKFIESRKPGDDFVIITGHGRHAHDGVSRIKTAVLDHLNKNYDVSVLDVNRGKLHVTIDQW